jgi:predicted nuclease of predicted toxin-antitoxin system
VVLPLRDAGWDAVHAIELGLSRASDASILDYARTDQRVICTLDADFHALLVTSGYGNPSVIRIRQEGLGGAQRIESLNDVGDNLIKQNAIARQEEDILAMISVQRDVIKRGGYVQSWLAWHPCSRNRRSITDSLTITHMQCVAINRMMHLETREPATLAPFPALLTFTKNHCWRHITLYERKGIRKRR